MINDKLSVGTYVNIMSDFGFKRIFGDPSSKDLLKDFLNALFRGDIVVEDIVYDNVEQVPLGEDMRGIRYDIYCHVPRSGDSSGKPTRHFIIEMQNDWQLHFDERAVFYLASAITRQGEAGPTFGYSLVPVIGIFVTAFDRKDVAQEPRMVERKGITDLDTHEIFGEMLRMYFVRLPQMRKEAEECRDEIEKWIYCIKNSGTMRTIPFAKTDPIFARLEERARVANLSKKERLEYETSLKAYRDYRNTMESNYQLGLTEGEARGQRDIVGRMHANGMSVAQIAAILNYPESTIRTWLS